MDGAAMDEQWLVRAGMLRACHVGMLGPAGRKRWTGKAMDAAQLWEELCA